MRSLPLLSGPAGAQRLRRALSVLSLLAVDVAATFLGIYLAFAAKLMLSGQPIDSAAIWRLEQQILPTATVVLVLVFAKNRLYAPRESRSGSATVLSSTTLAALAVLLLLVASGWHFQTYYMIYASWFFVSVLVIALRASYESITTLVLDASHYERRALLVGSDASAARVEAALDHTSNRRGVPYRVTGNIALEHLPAEWDGDEGTTLLDPSQVDEVIFTEAEGLSDQVVLSLLQVCRRRGIAVRLAPTTVEMLSHTIEAVPAPGFPLFSVHPPVLGLVQFWAKRLFDVVVGVLLTLLVAPFVGLMMLLIRLEDGGPVFHRSRRVGVDETTFDCLKLRTMYVGAEQMQTEVEHLNEADGALFKIREDPRVTRVGAFLRRYSLDELPQLINVLRGEMSLVGPRPLPVRDFEMLDAVQRKRYLVLPGMTGLWQVSGRSDLSFDELIRLDFYYIETWSIWLDFVILFRTIPVVLGRKGAF